MSDSLWPHGLWLARLLCPSLSPGVCSDSCQLSQWCYLSILSSASPFSFCLQSFPASGSFPVSCLFTSDGQSIRASVSASALPMNIQDWFPLRLTSLMSLLSKGLSRVFSSITVQKQTEIKFFWQPHGMVDHIRLVWIGREKGDIYFTLTWIPIHASYA